MKLYHIIIFLFVFSICLNAQVADDKEYSFSHIKIEDGLSQSSILAIHQDQRGFMWFGTFNGFNRYDGYEFKVYQNIQNDSTSISDNIITTIFEDDNYLWIGTYSGVLNRFDKKNEVFEQYSLYDENELDNSAQTEFVEYPVAFLFNDENSITCINEYDENTLLVGTWGRGLLFVDKNTKEFTRHLYPVKNSFSNESKRISDVLIDDKKNLWVATLGGGLLKSVKSEEGIDNVIFTEEQKGKFRDNRLLKLIKNGNGIWIGTYSGLYLQNENTNELIEVEELENSIVMDIKSDNNNLWIGTFGNGLFRYDKTTESLSGFSKSDITRNSISDNEIISLHIDQSGIIWIGSHLGEGLTRIKKNRGKFGLIANNPHNSISLNDDIVWAIHKDKKENLLVGTYRGGLNVFDKTLRRRKIYKNNPNSYKSISGNHIRAIAEDSRGNYWVGTYNNGLNFFQKNSEQFTRFTSDSLNPNGLKSNQIQSILIDDDICWVGTFTGGISYFLLSEFYSTGKIDFMHIQNNASDPNSLSSDKVYKIYKDHNNDIWVATYGEGLNKLNKEHFTFERYVHNPKNDSSLSDNRVISIYEDSFNNFWVGTYGGGLNKLNRKNKSFKRYNFENGLKGDAIYGILEDGNNHLWLSSDDGLFTLNVKNDTILYFDLNDGLQSMEFSGGAYFKSKQGEMFFGGINGVNYFYPEEIQFNLFIPPIVITSFKVFDQEQKGDRKNITLSHDENFFAFEFASLDYTSSKDNKYAYMLEGLESKWNYADSKYRMANYTNLAPGDYVFHVKGSNNDAIWNSEGIEINLTILAPFYYKWWFILLTFIVVVGTVMYVTTVRVKNLIAIEKIKSKLAADLHDSIGAGLTEISILSELVRNDLNGDAKDISGKLNRISNRSRDLVDNMSDIVWVVNPKRDSLYDLILRLKDSYSEFLEQTNISFKTANLEKLRNIKLPMEYKQNLLLLFKEAINNSIKHSKCNQITLEANIRNDLLSIKLVDNGIGINVKPDSLGNGLRNMEMRAENIGGKLGIDSSSQGTKLEFIGKIKKDIRISSLLKK